MRRGAIVLTLTTVIVGAGAVWSEETKKAGGRDMAKLKDRCSRLGPLHEKLGKPKPGDWLAEHPEPGQTADEYVACKPIVPQGSRNVIYIQPLGSFNKTQRRIVDLTAEFMGLYFGVPVKVRKDLPLSIVPAKARRRHPTWGMRQILTSFVLHDLLRPRLPEDAAAYLALTATDLYPKPSWNFVFGQASLRHRVGVWSLYRNGDPDENEAAYRLCLLRTLKTATHETGHMLSMLHCTLFECNMCGSNNREESDRRPLTLCPECLPKLAWATGVDPRERFKKLAAFAKANGLKTEQERYERSLELLGKD